MKFNRVLFDNMSGIDIRIDVKFLKRKYKTEASGNINLKNANKISKTGVDRLSVGSLTHSINALDLKFEI